MLQKKIENGIEYVLKNDYYIPNIVLEPEYTNYQIRRYGKLKLRYLKEHKKYQYTILFMKKNLNKYLHEIDEECEKKYDYLLAKMIQKEGINEELKMRNQLEWVGRINNLKNRINEIILREFIYN